MLSGANDLLSICRWGKRLTPKALEMLGIDRGRTPCHSTYHYVFQSISAADLERALGGLVLAEGPLGHVAIGPKGMRRAETVEKAHSRIETAASRSGHSFPPRP